MVLNILMYSTVFLWNLQRYYEQHWSQNPVTQEDDMKLYLLEGVVQYVLENGSVLGAAL